MPNYVVTPVWARTYVGATERYITPNLTGSSLTTAIGRLLTLRAALQHTDTYWMGIRVSLYGGGRRSSFLRPPIDYIPGIDNAVSIPTFGTYAASDNVLNGATLMQASLQTNVTFDTDRTARVYLCDLPKAIVGYQPATYNYTSTPNWSKALVDFKTFLINNAWNIRALSSDPSFGPFSVVGLIADPTTTQLGVIIQTLGSTSLRQGVKIQLMFFRSAKGTRNPTLNGTWVVSSVVSGPLLNQTTVYLRSSEGINPALQRITAHTVLRQNAYALYSIQTMIGQQVCTHKRGKPLLAGRGRRLSRPSLDP